MSESSKVDVETPIALPQWSCEFQEQSRPLAEWTVGDTYLLSCQGTVVEERFSDKTQVIFEDDSLAYSLYVLEVLYADYDRAQFLVTGYKPTAEPIRPTFILSDGQTQVQVENLSWSVQTVIDSQESMHVEPYPPYGPFWLSLPMGYWLAIVLFFTVLLFFFGRFLWRWNQRKKLLDKLTHQSTALEPYHQFNKEWRALMRKYSSPVLQSKEEEKKLLFYVERLDQSVRSYLMYQFKVPAMEWTSNMILKDIKKYHKKIYRQCETSLKMLLRELDKAKHDPSRLNSSDCEQLFSLSRKVADELYRASATKTKEKP